MKYLIPTVCILCAVPGLALARNVFDTHFAGPGNSACFIRSYDTAHLAKNPDQLVTSMALTIAPIAQDDGNPVLIVSTTFRGESYLYSAFAYCDSAGDALKCFIEGDGGSFTLTGRGKGKLLLSVDRGGMSFEGDTRFHTISGLKGDDRSFLIPSVSADLCN